MNYLEKARNAEELADIKAFQLLFRKLFASPGNKVFAERGLVKLLQSKNIVDMFVTVLVSNIFNPLIFVIFVKRFK